MCDRRHATYVAYMSQEKMVLGGAARNRMLIKGGSSFNALVRALKQDVVTGAAPTTTSSDRLMYEVDKVSPKSLVGPIFPHNEDIDCNTGNCLMCKVWAR